MNINGRVKRNTVLRLLDVANIADNHHAVCCIVTLDRIPSFGDTSLAGPIYWIICNLLDEL